MFPKVLYTDEYDSNKQIIECKGYILAKGGDGTLLKAIARYTDLKKPFFGEAAGTANFLMNKEDKPRTDCKILKTNRIKVEVTYTKEKEPADKSVLYSRIKTQTFQAFNDVMIGGDMNSWIDFNVTEKDELFGQFKGGGLIISTPQGSTGVNKTNGGTILPLSSTLWSITGDKTDANIDYVIKPRVTTIEVKSRTPISLWVDGSNNIVENVISVTISKGDKVEVIFNDYKEFMKKRRAI